MASTSNPERSTSTSLSDSDIDLISLLLSPDDLPMPKTFAEFRDNFKNSFNLVKNKNSSVKDDIRLLLVSDLV